MPVTSWASPSGQSYNSLKDGMSKPGDWFGARPAATAPEEDAPKGGKQAARLAEALGAVNHAPEADPPAKTAENGISGDTDAMPDDLAAVM